MYTLTIEDSNTQIADQFSFDHGSYVIGRLDECDIVLPSSSVSRKHARIFIENDRCFIEDLGSANGVIVDGQRVIQRRDLGTASQIRIGDFYLYLEFKATGQHGRQSVLNTLFISNNSDHHKLVRVNDSFAGEEFSLSEIENTIGRTDDNFILLSDQSISRQHAKIVRDADHYTLVDLGSSNGTRLNGSSVSGSKRLKPGDVVEFGDVEFVFTEGDVQVNLSEYTHKKASRNNLTFVGGLAVLVLFGLALGGLIVYALFWFKQSKQEAQPREQAVVAAPESVEGRASSMLEEGKSHMRRREWDNAISSFDEVLALAPDNQEAQKLRQQARAEQEAGDLLLKGEELSEQGRHNDAREVLMKIPEDTVAAQRAKPTIEHVEKTLAHNLKNEAIRLLKDSKLSKAEMQKAHEKLVRSLDLAPDDEEALEAVREVESMMKKKRVDFKKYARQ
ncbi:FHA domain-containing protein [Persicimonas caeni]|uniref:FHA domain-containing protein n=1 Tax=Persicimonas caeni TaxID=2292766 RepID=A0A4Y6Q1V3_PERCE|nr:FHA domain-containing protein [Persicimonas caeni]QDG54439.1 FHA domain-containing protein [Persicimonas caeni]QED35660.1 FHA domain-containing protein [Persicimonas caeni]